MPLVLTIDGQTYRDGVDMAPLEFWRRVRRVKELPRSSQPSAGDFRTAYERLLERHEGIVSLHIAGALSGTVQAAEAAARAVAPDRIRVIDSCKVSVGVGLLAEAAGEAADAGGGLDEVEAAVLAARDRTRVWGTVATLEFAVRGGRIDARVARVLEVLHLQPVIAFSDDGQGRAGRRRLGYEAALRSMVRRAVRFAGGAPARAMVVHADALGAAERVAEELCRRLERDRRARGARRTGHHHARRARDRRRSRAAPRLKRREPDAPPRRLCRRGACGCPASITV